MARNDPQVNLRIDAALKDRLDEAAKENQRTLTAEVVSRLSDSFDGDAERNRAAEVIERLTRTVKDITGHLGTFGAAFAAAARGDMSAVDAFIAMARRDLEKERMSPEFDLGTFLANLSQAANRAAGDMKEVGRLVREANEELERNASEWRVVRDFNPFDGMTRVTIVRREDLPVFEKASTRSKADDD